MRKIIILITAAAGLFLYADNKPEITAAEAKHHVGQFKTVVGTVVSGKYLSRSKGKPTFINLDKPYPNQIFTILIWGSDRSKFKQPPESLYYGKKIAVTGMIIDYKGVFEIIVRNPSQIKLKD